MPDQTRIPLKHPSKPSPPPGGWPTGGTEVIGWHLCTPCGDSIYPGEHVYDNGDDTVRCAVCEIKHRATGARPVPTTRQRMDEALALDPSGRYNEAIGASGRLTDARRCHTPEQHRHTDGHDNDAASHDRAMREALTERDEWEQVAAQSTKHVAELTDQRNTLRTALAEAKRTATFRQGVNDSLRQDLSDAGDVIAVVREAVEQVERALARYDTAPEVTPVEAECDGLCVSAADVGVGRADQIAYPHPSCPLHDPDEVCQCGHPDRCLSPTHAPDYAPLGSPSPRAQDDRNALVYNAISRALLDCDPWAPLATLRERCTAAVLAALDEQPADEQALRDRVEHAIRARLAKAWPFLADEAWINQAAAMAAVAAVQALTPDQARP